jgi:hypothetical protein
MKSLNSTFRAASLALALGAFTTLAQAITLYTDSTTFTALVGNSTLETFESRVSTPETSLPASYTANGFTYAFNNGASTGGVSVRSSTNTGSLKALSTATASSNAVLVISFTGGAPTHVGGNFFSVRASDFLFDPVTNQNDAISVKVTLSDNTSTTYNYTPSAFSQTYRGFVSPQGTTITQIEVNYTGTFNDNGGFVQNLTTRLRTVDNLLIGTAIPEPSTWAALVGLAALGLVASRRRRSV